MDRKVTKMATSENYKSQKENKDLQKELINEAGKILSESSNLLSVFVEQHMVSWEKYCISVNNVCGQCISLLKHVDIYHGQGLLFTENFDITLYWMI